MAQRARSYKKPYVDIAPPEQYERPVSLLSEEEMAEIESEIVAEIEEEERERQRKIYREEAKLSMKRAKGLAEEQVEVIIDVAGHAQDIKLDGRPYFHGHTYIVPLSVASTLYDIMGRTWDHEESVGGANQNEYRKPRNTRMLGGRPISGAPQQNQTMGAPIPSQAASHIGKDRITPRVTSTQSLRDSRG